MPLVISPEEAQRIVKHRPIRTVSEISRLADHVQKKLLKAANRYRLVSRTWMVHVLLFTIAAVVIYAVGWYYMPTKGLFWNVPVLGMPIDILFFATVIWLVFVAGIIHGLVLMTVS